MKSFLKFFKIFSFILLYLLIIFLIIDRFFLNKIGFPANTNKLTSKISTLDRIKQRGSIRVGTCQDTPPYAMKAKLKKVINNKTVYRNEDIGFDIDIAKILAEVLNVKLDLVYFKSITERITALKKDRVDVVISDLTRTAARAMDINFSIPYLEISQAVIVRKKDVPSTVSSYFDLSLIKNIKIGVKKATTIEQFALELFGKNRIISYPNQVELEKALLSGKVSALAYDSPFIRIWNRKNQHLASQYSVLLEPVTQEFYSIGIRKGDYEFVHFINVFIEDLKSDGFLYSLQQKYFKDMDWLTGVIEEKKYLNRAEALRDQFMKGKENSKKAFEKRLKDTLKNLRL